MLIWGVLWPLLISTGHSKLVKRDWNFWQRETIPGLCSKQRVLQGGGRTRLWERSSWLPQPVPCEVGAEMMLLVHFCDPKVHVCRAVAKFTLRYIVKGLLKSSCHVPVAFYPCRPLTGKLFSPFSMGQHLTETTQDRIYPHQNACWTSLGCVSVLAKCPQLSGPKGGEGSCSRGCQSDFTS